MATTSSASLLNVHYTQHSVKQVQLRWFVSQQKGEVGGRPPVVQISIMDHAGDEHKEWICQRAGRENVADVYDLPSHLLVPGHKYEVSVKLLSSNQSSANGDDESNGLMQVHHTETLNFRLSYSANEMRKLQDLATSFTLENGKWVPCDLFYRDKDKEYYEYCQYRWNGLLPPVLKNENGDPASPINGSIKGIFMEVNVNRKTGKLPTNSPFGYLRFHIPIEYVYGSGFNLYFADFYCHAGSKSHRLTLVITRANSPTDLFCRHHLPMLNRTDNPFLYQDPITGRMMQTTSAWIDILYTEMIPISDGWLDTVHCCTVSRKMGKQKNSSCPVCNINIKK